MPFRSVSVRLARLLAFVALLGVSSFAGAQTAPPIATLYFSPSTVVQGGSAQLVLQIYNPDSGPLSAGTISGYNFSPIVGLGTTSTYDFATGLACTGSATSSGSSMSLSGLTLAPGDICMISVDVATSVAGSFSTTFPAAAFSASTGTSAASGPSTLTVLAPIVVNSALDPTDPGKTTLRDAINSLNSNCNVSGLTFSFNIPGTGPHVISPLTQLPAITCDGVVIDAYTQPGSSPNSNAAGPNNAVVGIILSGASCPGCSGLTLAPMVASRLGASKPSPAAMAFFGGGVTIKGFAIGSFPGDGVAINSSQGSGYVLGSNISSNGSNGVNFIFGGGAVGGTSAGDFNVIASNGGAGVNVPGTGIAILGNAIFMNAGRGIELGGAAPGIDHCDPDGGANGQQNYPVITSAVLAGGNLTISGTFDSVDGVTYRLEFFSNPPSDSASNRGGREFLGSTPAATGTPPASCLTPWSLVVPFSGTAGETITATATDPSGNTSWFSAEAVVTSTAPTITLTPSSLGFGSIPALTTSAPQTVTLLNNGPNALTPTFTISGDFGFISNCPGSVAALATCTINVTFTPLVPGLRTGTLSVASNASGSPHTVALSGTGLVVPAPDILVTPGVTEYGAQGIGTDSAVQIITVNSTGTAPLTLGTIDTTLADFVIRPTGVAAGRACGTTLAPGDSCDVAVVFHPTAEGIRDGQLRVANNTASSPATVRIVGRGIIVIPPRQLGMVGQLAFGSLAVGITSPSQPLVITNNTASPVSITGLDTTGDFSVSNSCATVAARATCTLLVFFQPTAVGDRAGAITVHALADSVPYIVTLSGTGTPNPLPALRLSATTLGFGNVIYGSSFSQGISLTNVGTVPLTLISILTSGNSDFAVGTCPATMAPGAQCNLAIRFSPHALGARSGRVTVTSNAVGSPHTVTLGGTGCRYFSPAAARFFLTSC